MSKAERPAPARGGESPEIATGPEEKFTSPSSVMEEVFAKPSRIGGSRIDGVVIGTLADIEDGAHLLVNHDFAPTAEPVEALSTAELSSEDIGREVALAFVGGDPDRPLVLGVVKHPSAVAAEAGKDETELLLDGEKLVFDAAREIVLRCGDSSITLTRAGKIILKGKYVSTHSAGVNRIKGGSIQIN